MTMLGRSAAAAWATSRTVGAPGSNPAMTAAAPKTVPSASAPAPRVSHVGVGALDQEALRRRPPWRPTNPAPAARTRSAAPVVPRLVGANQGWAMSTKRLR
jgi:hypothetical protein